MTAEVLADLAKGVCLSRAVVLKLCASQLAAGLAIAEIAGLCP